MKIANLIFLILYLELCWRDIRAVWRKESRMWKPFLMPSLMAYFATGWVLNGNRAADPVFALVLCGLFCGFLGDTLLLKPERFAAGLGAFLIGHFCYIASYVVRIGHVSVPVPGIAAAAAGYMLAAVLIVKPLLPFVEKALKIPVLVYMTAILAMSFAAFLRFGNCGSVSWALTLAGSVLFIVSDSLLAYQVFRKKTDRGIMETYVAAQFLIAQGMLMG